MKRILALLLAVMMTVSCFAVSAEELGEDGTSTPGSGDVILPDSYTVTIADSENCTVTIMLDGEVTENTSFDENTEITVVAAAAEGFDFVKWVEVGEDNEETDIADAGARYTFTVSRNITLKAIVEESAVTYSVSITGEAKVGSTLKAVVSPEYTENTLSYSWYILDSADEELSEEKLSETEGAELLITSEMKDKYITVSVTINDVTYTAAATAQITETVEEQALYTIDYEEEKITYDEDKIIVSSAKSAAKKIASGKTVKPATTYYYKLVDNDSEEEVWESFTLAERPAKPERKNIRTEKASSYSSDDGEIILPSTDMQYKRDNWSKWKDAAKKNVTGLEEGTYLVRYKGSNEEEKFPSDSVNVTVGYSGSSGGSSGGSSYKVNNGTVITTTTVGNGSLGGLNNGGVQNNDDSEVSFDDIIAHWAKTNIQKAVKKGWFNGVDSKNFMPDRTTTRGMIIAILARMSNADLSGYQKSAFVDVLLDDYFGAAAAWGSENGIISGMGDGTFAPNGELTREQIAVILYRYAIFLNKDVTVNGDISGFADAAEVADYAKDALSWACALNIISGRDGNLLAPKGTATRAEIATMLVRFEEYVK